MVVFFISTVQEYYRSRYSMVLPICICRLVLGGSGNGNILWRNHDSHGIPCDTTDFITILAHPTRQTSMSKKEIIGSGKRAKFAVDVV